MDRVLAKAAAFVWVAVVFCGCGEDAVQPQPSESQPGKPQPIESAATTPEPTGAIEGTVRFVGQTIPISTMVPVGADPQYCGHQHSKEDYVIDADSRGIRYVIVHLKRRGLKDWPDTKPGHLVLDNKDCRFEPHAAVLTVGSTIELRNSDTIFHTTHAYFGASFNFALPEKGSSVTYVIQETGLTQIRCDKHGWMNAFIRVDRHPLHAVSDAQGRFKISGVPPGQYTLAIWHEKFGPHEMPIVVQAGKTEQPELTYPIPNEDQVSP